MNRIPKDEYELEVFQALARLIGLEVVRGSIRQPDPPDIVCEVQGEGSVAYELVSLDADETRMRLDNMGATDAAWKVALAKMTPAHQDIVRSATADVYFTISFADEAGSRDRAAVCRLIQAFLMAHPQHTGPLPREVMDRAGGLLMAVMHRGQVTRGPKFSQFSSSRWLPPQIDKLVGKMRPDRYKGLGVPLELFAYSVHDEPDMAVGSLEGIQQAIVAHLPTSSFRRAHVFDLGFQRHLFSYPA